MSLKPDDLRTGQWVAVTHSRETVYGPMGQMEIENRMADGRPLKILAVNYPFIGVTDGRRKYALDVREVSFTRLNRRYATEMSSGRRRRPCGHDSQEAESGDPSRACPMCGERLVEHLIDKGTWGLACRCCGFQGFPPQNSNLA